jgi:hypothetical protein
MFSRSTLNKIKPRSGVSGSSRIHPHAHDNKILARNWLEKYGSTRKPLEIFMAPDEDVIWFYHSPKTRGNRAFPLEISQDRSTFIVELERLYEFYQQLVIRFK